MDLPSELRASGLLAATDAAAAIDAGWEVSEFGGADVADLLRIYPIRLKHVRTLRGEHAEQLSRSTEELVGRLSDALHVEVGFIRGDAEHHFIVFRDADREVAIGVLRVFSKLDVPSKRWEQLWGES